MWILFWLINERTRGVVVNFGEIFVEFFNQCSFSVFSFVNSNLDKMKIEMEHQKSLI